MTGLSYEAGESVLALRERVLRHGYAPDAVVVVKYGGAAMLDARCRENVAEDIVFLRTLGLRPIVVHGGGPDISKRMRALGLPVSFHRGLRVTTPEAMKVVRSVLVDETNQELVSAMNAHGAVAVGLAGDEAGLVSAVRIDPLLGEVGEVVEIGVSAIEAAFAQELIPVVASVAASEDGATLNINADLLASAFAVRFAASSLFFLTDVEGVYEQFEDKTSMIEELSLTRAEQMLKCGTVSEGMIPKIDACIRAVRGGVEHTRVINGTERRVLVSEVTSNRLSGTTVARHADWRL